MNLFTEEHIYFLDKKIEKYKYQTSTCIQCAIHDICKKGPISNLKIKYKRFGMCYGTTIFKEI